MIFYILTIIFGAVYLGLALNLFIIFFGLPSEIKVWIYAYILVGYVVMIYCKIKTPLSEKAIKDYRGIEFRLFFRDLYYALWWPYYLWNR